MKKSDELDNLLRSKMEQYHISPTPGSKARYLAEGIKVLQKQNHFKDVKIWFTIILLLFLGIISITYFSLKNTEIISNENDSNSFLNSVPGKIQSHSGNLNSNETNLSPIQNEENKDDKLIQTDIVKFSTTNNQLIANEINRPTFPNTKIDDKLENSGIQPLISLKYSNITIYDSSMGIVIEKESFPLNNIQTNEEKVKQKKVENYSGYHFLFDLYYCPEIIFNVIDSKHFTNSFGAELQYRFFNNRYLLRTGLGLSISQGYYEYIIDYQQHLGVYNDLDSITYSLASDNFHLLPSYYFSEEDIFDTAITNHAVKYFKKFTYLQIPLIMGYDFVQRSNLSFGIRIGPLLSLLLNDQNIETNYEAGKNKIIQINKITPDRIHVNWQIVAGINSTIYPGDHLFFEIEPRFTYYFNSVYQKSNNTNPPFSIGLRIAAGIKK